MATTLVNDAIVGQFLAGQRLVGQSHYLVDVPGVPSAGSLGGVAASVFLPGVPSAAAFGTVKANQIVHPQGLQPWTYTPSIVGQFLVGDGHLVGGAYTGYIPFGQVTVSTRTAVAGISSAQAFGVVRPLNILRLLGVPSAQSFGVSGIVVGPVRIPVSGVPSAGLVGRPRVFIIWVRPVACDNIFLSAGSCSDVVLSAGTTQTVELEAGVCA